MMVDPLRSTNPSIPVVAPNISSQNINNHSEKNILNTEDHEKSLRFDAFAKVARKAKSLIDLENIKKDAIAYSRQKKKDGVWDLENDGQRLRDILGEIKKRESDLNTFTVELEAPEITKILRDDIYQHTCDMKMCFRVAIGWTCVFLFCHIPWIVGVFFIYKDYRINGFQVEVNTTVNASSIAQAKSACEQTASYVFGFFIIYVVNVIVGLIVASARTVDESKNACTKITPYITIFISFAIIGYNFYGIIVVWNYSFWNVPIVGACVDIRGLAVALISFFFLLPILCFGFSTIIQRKEIKNEEEETLNLNQVANHVPNTSNGGSFMEKKEPGLLLASRAKTLSSQQFSNNV